MIPLVFIIALYLEPVGTITEEPYDFVQGIETIEVIELEDLEREMERQRFRIMLENLGDGK